jgi:hypothetical protein
MSDGYNDKFEQEFEQGPPSDEEDGLQPQSACSPCMSVQDIWGYMLIALSM